ncbi:MAG: STAS domain-containing protein [Gammaproteobacteria bacterium]|nr:STAS domain-containing protein [Gammaproteobacteria bacterium]
MTINTTVSEEHKTVTIDISGQFNASMHREFRNAYKDSVENPASYKFIINLARADYMDSSALGMLLLLKEHVCNESDNIVITQANPTIRDILEIAKFDTMFTLD